MLDYHSSPLTFRTFPRLSTGIRFKFVISSCAVPNFPHRGPWHRRSIKDFDLLVNYFYSSAFEASNVSDATSSITHPSKADFMLFLGDFIYADVPIYLGGFQPYFMHMTTTRRVWASDFWSAFTDTQGQLINTFGASGDDSTPPYLNASGEYELYNSNANFDPVSPGEHL